MKKGMNNGKLIVNLILFLTSAILLLNFVGANTYLSDIYFTIPDSVYKTNERIEMIGYLYQANYSSNGTIVTPSAILTNALVNFTISNSTNTSITNITFTTDSNGAFYSRSTYYPAAKNVTSPANEGIYKLRAEYKDLNNATSFSEVQISVVNQSVDTLSLRSNKAVYNPSELVNVEASALRSIGDSVIFVSNVSINGTVRNATKSVLQAFNCTTGNNGKCSINFTASSTYGDYIIELNNFKSISSFSVVPFSYTLYMKDELNSLKNIFAQGEKASVEVKIANASDSNTYTFSGYIADSAGNSVKTISSTVLNSSNAFTNSFSYTVDAITFGYGTYSTYVTVSKTGDGSISSITTFQVQDWMLSVNKRSSSSGFEYEYSTFADKVLNFEAIPTYRANGTVLENISSSSFNISLRDSLNNIINSTTAGWNATCGKSGCYNFSLAAPATAGKYILQTTLSTGGDTQTHTRVINVISGVLSAQSTDKDGNLKELFGTTDHVYLLMSSYNTTSTDFNLTDAEIFIVSYMNGTEYNYTNVTFNSVNTTNTQYEWAWNASSQMLRMDAPKYGGLYNIFIFGDNKTLGTKAKFIINPYDYCTIPKNTPSSNVSSASGYYVSQFKTSDTIYFEIQLTQATNPLGKAAALNGSNNSYGKFNSGCNADSSVKQVVNNATVSVINVKNVESGALQTLNNTATSCQSMDNSGRYSCTLQPLSKWSGGSSIVTFDVKALDGTISTFYGNFESRAFYLYGYSSTWQNNPESSITLTLNMYEAGSNWWSNYGNAGLGGTVTLKKVEYMGRDGEWLWPPVDSGYNVTNVTSTTITSGSGTMSIPVNATTTSRWKTGYYRAVLQATTSSGDSDYGYAWFGVKLWDVYGQPIECTNASCNYKSYYSSKENVTLYVTIAKAGTNWWYGSSYNNYQNIYGNISIGVKKIEDCKSWPCKELNSSDYSATTIYVNASSPSYWNSNITGALPYIVYINKTNGKWSTGWYNVVLNVNGTDTGWANFNAIAFYVEANPTNQSGSGWKYSVRGNQPVYFNVTTTRNYKWSYSSTNARYNDSTDYVNATLRSAVLRTWNSDVGSKEFNYPTDFNISTKRLDGNTLINITYVNGSWPTGYYWGEMTLNNSADETSSGYLWFNVQPFRAQIYSTNYNFDSDKCANGTLNIYDPDWSSSSLLLGNYSIVQVYEDVWAGSSYSRVGYTNYTINGGSNVTNFNASTNNVTVCPNNGQWGGGNWGGYHSLNLVVKDNVNNDTQTGWLSFRSIPFSISWGSVGSYKLSNANLVTTVSLTKPAGGNGTGNLTGLYQWRYDNGRSTKETYRFVVNQSGTTCDSDVSTNCKVNGTGVNITVYAPSGGWKVGWNYIQADWIKDTDSTVQIQDYSGINFEARGGYNGYFSNTNSSGSWNYYIAPNKNMTIKLTAQKADYSAAASITISSVYYSNTQNCWSDSCRAWTSSSFSPSTVDSNGIADIQMAVPSNNWTTGDYAIKVIVTGGDGTSTISGGNLRVKTLTAPTVTLSVPVINATYNKSMSFSATTNKNAQCNIGVNNYVNFNNWYCGSWNTSNSTLTAASKSSCNATLYPNFNGTIKTSQYISNNYNSFYDDTNWSSCWTNAGVLSCGGKELQTVKTFISTGGTSHTYTLNVSDYPTQHYGMQMYCYDEDGNYVNSLVAFKINNSL